MRLFRRSISSTIRKSKVDNELGKEFVILRMGPDPEPDKSIGRFNCECAIPITYSD